MTPFRELRPKQRPESSYAPIYARYPARGAILEKQTTRSALRACRTCHSFHTVKPDGKTGAGHPLS